MTLRNLFYCALILCLLACSQTTSQDFSKPVINPQGKTVETRISPPEGYTRIDADQNSFTTYLRNIPLRPDGSVVKLYNGSPKVSIDVYVAVADLPIGKRDLHQCADAVMRLRAEYLWQHKRYDEIHFNFTNGFRADYSKWRAGYHISVKGNEVSWYNANAASDSYESFWKYLEMVFSYAGTLSLNQELKPTNIDKIKPGDVFIQGGSPGHAVIVLDVAKHNQTGKHIFMLAQSYMPAQELQILKNRKERDLSPWYDANFEDELNTPEWTFKKSDLKSF